MDAFSYLSILLSIIVGLGLTQILTAVGRIIRHRDRVRARSARPPASTSITGLPAPAGSVSEHRVAAAMVGILGASLSMAALRAQVWVLLVPSLLLTLLGWGASVVLWIRDQWLRPAQ